MTSLDGDGTAAVGSVRFLGARRSYWRLLVRGAVLLMVTLGIYRFWLMTDVRRFLWSNTEVAGESLEYAGTALELLLGFLVAVALLIPLYAGFFIAALDLGTLGQIVGRDRLPGAVRARPIRGLPGAALSPDPHHLSRPALPSERLGLGLRLPRHRLVGGDHPHLRPRLSVPARQPRALQDGEHLVRRSRRPLRRHAASACCCAACRSGCWWSGRWCWRSSPSSTRSTGRRSPTRSTKAATT